MIHTPKGRVGLLGISAGVALVLCAASNVYAQATTETTQLKSTVVTGTYLESADAAGTLTVTPVELTAPINQGYSTVEDVLRTKLPQYGGPGNLNPSFGNGGDGNSYLALRGLPGNATLVLVNGRRTAISALNLIPDAAVEKIEILNDGGSAIYGSDAVAGVVNIILKKNFQGTKIYASYGGTTQSPNVNERKFQLLSGETTEKGSFVISAEYSAADELLSPDRSPSNTAVGRSGTGNPGTIFNNTDYGTIEKVVDGVTVQVPKGIGLSWHVNPKVTTGLTDPSQIPAGFDPLAFTDTSSANSTADARAMRDADVAARNAALGANSPVLYGNGPPFPYPVYTTLYRPHEKYDFSGSGEYKLINDAVKLFADAYYVNYRSSSQLAPSPLSGLTIPLNNYWWNHVFGAPSNPSADVSENYRIVELGPRIYNDQFEDFRFVGGLRGEIPDTSWKYELGYLFTKDDYYQTANGGVVLSKLDALLGATDPSAWNPFGYTPIGGSSTVNPNVSQLGDSALLHQVYQTTGFDFNTSGNLFELPGGAVALGVGMAYRRESFDQLPDLATKDALIWPFNQILPYSAVRNIWAGYGEAVVPIFGKDFSIPAFSEFSVSAAVRYEDYDDVGDTGLKPRVSFRWKPLEKQAFSIRGSYAQGFSAPVFGDLYAPPGQDFIQIYNPYTGVYEQPTDAVLTTGNPNLKPTDSETWLIGGEYSPKFIKGFTIGGDYYRIEQSGVPFASADYIVNQWYKAGGNNNPNNPWGPTVGPSGPNPAGTQVEYNEVTGQFTQIRNLAPINAGKRMTDGIDLQMSEALEFDFGTFTLSGLATRVLNFDQQDVPGAPTVHYLNRYWGSGAALPDTGYPEWRASVTLSYEWKRFTAAFGWNFTSGYVETYNEADRDVSAYNTFDIRVGYKIPYIETSLMVGVNNIADQDPSTVYSSFENNFDRAIGDPRGRMIFVSLSKQF